MSDDDVWADVDVGADAGATNPIPFLFLSAATHSSKQYSLSRIPNDCGATLFFITTHVVVTQSPYVGSVNISPVRSTQY